MKLALLTLLGVSAFAQALTPSGNFVCTIQSGATPFRLALHLTTAPDGSLAGTVDSLDQNVYGMPANGLQYSGGVLSYGTGATRYEGKVNASGTEIDGVLIQSGARLPCLFRKTTRPLGPVRPQTPVAPFPYIDEEIVIEHHGVRLTGTLTIPVNAARPLPAAILLNGSGPQDRDYTVFEHKPFLILADFLARIGFAVLRMDDRGTGASSGNSAQATMDDLTADAITMVDTMRFRKEVDPKRLGLIGHSEGANVAIMAASKVDLAFVISLAGIGVPAADLLYSQGQAVLKALNADPLLLERQNRLQHLLIPEILSEKDPAKLEAKLRSAVARFKSEVTPSELAKTPDFDGQMETEIRRLMIPATQSFIRHDPRPFWKALRCPVLVLQGSLDSQVPSRQNLPAIAALLAESGVETYSIQSLPSLNHFFQTSRTGAISEYAAIDETFSPAALAVIGRWFEGLH